MRRILISKRGEFNYQGDRSNSLGYAIKKLGNFFEGVERKESESKKVTVSNNLLKATPNHASSSRVCS